MALVPFQYNLRNLFTRKGSTLLTTLSIGATVAVLAGMLSLQQGFATMFVSRGSDDVAVFLRPGATSEGESAFRPDLAEILAKETPEIAIDADDEPLASAELYLAVRRFKLDGGETNVPLRGVEPASFAIHGETLHVVEGERFRPGTDEVIVGRGLVGRIRNCEVGEVLVINTTPFRVTGVFEGKGGYNSEIWGDTDRLLAALDRSSYNRVLARLQPGTDVAALAARLEDDKRVPAKVMTERAYLESQTTALSALFLVLGALLSIVMGVAAIFTGTNAMFTQVAARTHDVGILLSVGFRPVAIFAAFLFEAAVLGLLGGLVGCLLVLPLNGMQTGTMNMQTFSEATFAFRITPLVALVAVGFSLALGLIGGAVPAWRASRLSATTALRRH